MGTKVTSARVEHTFVVGPEREDNPAFGALLRELRENAGLSVAQAAKAASLSAAYIRMIENGDKAPAQGTVIKLFVAYGQADLAVVEPRLENGLRPDLVVQSRADGPLIAIEFKSRIREARGDAAERQVATLVGKFLEHQARFASHSAELPPVDAETDAALGRIMRRLAVSPASVLREVEALLDRCGG